MRLLGSWFEEHDGDGSSRIAAHQTAGVAAPFR
jgi:hypothetical protein